MKRALLLALSLAAVSPAEDRPVKPPPPDPAEMQKAAAEFRFEVGKRGGTLHDWLSSDLPGFNYPLSSDPALSGVFGGQVFEALFERDAVTLAWTARLAAAVPEASEDAEGTVWLVHLREGVRWHDGEPFTADDVVFTFNDILLNDGVRAPGRASVEMAVPDGAGGTVRRPIRVEKVDALTVKFTLPQRHALWPNLFCASAIFPKHVLAPAVAAGALDKAWGLDTPPGKVVGTGPFRFAAYARGTSVTLRRNPDWYRRDEAGNALPYLEEIVFHIITDPERLTDAFLDRTLDYVEMRESAVDSVLERARRKDFDVVNRGPRSGWTYLAFNQNPRAGAGGKPLVPAHKSAWFRDLRFRRAVAHALDRDRIIQEAYGGSATAIWSPYTPKFRACYTDDVRKCEFSRKQARALLDGIGLKDADGDGIREDGEGHPVEFETLYVEGGASAKVLEILAEELEKLGVRMTARPIPFNQLTRRLTQDCDWEAVLLGYSAGAEPLLGKAVWKSGEPRRVWNPKSPAGSPDERDWEKRLDAIFDEAYTSWDPDKRRFRSERDVELAHEWQRLCAENLPHIYLFVANDLYFVSHRIRNRRTTLHSLFDLDRIWLEE